MINYFVFLHSYQNTITRQWKELAERPQSMKPNHSLGDPKDMQTGVFLQLFTNSVNRALHKQHCTCNGKNYEAHELFAKSNPGLFGPCGCGAYEPLQQVPNKEKKRTPKQQTDVKLPPVASKTATIPHKKTGDAIKEATRSLKRQLKTRGGDTSGEKVSPRSKPLGDANIAEPEDELRLPSIMEIRDRNGNNWKIVQEPSRRTRQQQKRDKMRNDGKVFRTLSTKKLQLAKSQRKVAIRITTCFLSHSKGWIQTLLRLFRGATHLWYKSEFRDLKCTRTKLMTKRIVIGRTTVFLSCNRVANKLRRIPTARTRTPQRMRSLTKGRGRSSSISGLLWSGPER